MSVAALVLGIVGLVLSLVPCLGMYAMPLTILAAIFGGLGMKKPQGKGMAIAGLVCGIIGTLIAAWWLYAFLSVKSAVDKGAKQFEKDLKEEAEKRAKEAAETPTPDPKPEPAAPAPTNP